MTAADSAAIRVLGSVKLRGFDIHFECVQVESSSSVTHVCPCRSAKIVDLPCQVALCAEPGDQILVDKDKLFLRTRYGTLEPDRP
jgi:hypothetical protein